MGEVLRGYAGGIAGLLLLPAEQWQAIEADLLRCGKTRAQMGTPALPWSALVAMVRHAKPGDALYRATHGDRGRWTDAEYLLAWIVDLLNLLVWFKTKDGQKGRNRPKPVTRPSDQPDRFDAGDLAESGAFRPSKPGSTSFGVPMTIAELDEFLKN